MSKITMWEHSKYDPEGCLAVADNEDMQHTGGNACYMEDCFLCARVCEVIVLSLQE